MLVSDTTAVIVKRKGPKQKAKAGVNLLQESLITLATVSQIQILTFGNGERGNKNSNFAFGGIVEQHDMVIISEEAKESKIEMKTPMLAKSCERLLCGNAPLR